MGERCPDFSERSCELPPVWRTPCPWGEGTPPQATLEHPPLRPWPALSQCDGQADTPPIRPWSSASRLAIQGASSPLCSRVPLVREPPSAWPGHQLLPDLHHIELRGSGTILERDVVGPQDLGLSASRRARSERPAPLTMLHLGREPERHSHGQEFNSPRLHHLLPRDDPDV